MRKASGGRNVVSARVADADRARLDAILNRSAVNLRDRSAAWQKAAGKLSILRASLTARTRSAKSASSTATAGMRENNKAGPLRRAALYREPYP